VVLLIYFNDLYKDPGANFRFNLGLNYFHPEFNNSSRFSKPAVKPSLKPISSILSRTESLSIFVSIETTVEFDVSLNSTVQSDLGNAGLIVPSSSQNRSQLEKLFKGVILIKDLFLFLIQFWVINASLC